MKIKKSEPPKPQSNIYFQLVDTILKDIDDFEHEHEGKFDGILTERTGKKIKALFPEIAKKYFE